MESNLNCIFFLNIVFQVTIIIFIHICVFFKTKTKINLIAFFLNMVIKMKFAIMNVKKITLSFSKIFISTLKIIHSYSYSKDGRGAATAGIYLNQVLLYIEEHLHVAVHP